MGGHLLNLTLLLMFSAFANGKVQLNITAAVNSSCPQDPCVSLSQFSASPSHYSRDESDICLVFFPGNHTLERELSLYGADNFSMESQHNETAVIECASYSASFVVRETTFITIKGLHLIGCGITRSQQWKSL